ncbi:hypothetical protein ACNOYE_27230 [Nannocystaceae bacterium ST9]
MRANSNDSLTGVRRPPSETGPREFGVFVRALAIFLIVVGLVGLLEFVGLVRAGDAGVHNLWFATIERFDLARRSNEKVILITDAGTELAKEDWTADVLLDMFTRVDEGHPTLIAAVGQKSMFESNAGRKLIDELAQFESGARPVRSEADRLRRRQLERFAAASEDRVLLLHEDGESLWDGSAFDGEALVDGDLLVAPESRFAHVIQRTALSLPRADRLPVHWLLPNDRLPRVEMGTLLRGDISAALNFQDKIVLFGVVEDEIKLATPAGMLSSAEIEAHALAGLSDGEVWSDPPRSWMWLATVLVGAALLWFLHRSSGRVGALLGLLLIVAVLAADYLAFTSGVLRLGVTRPIAMILAIQAGYWALQAWDTISGLGRLHERVLYETGADRGEGEVEEAAFWDDLAEMGKVYAEQVVAGAASCSVVERGEGWQLRVRASAGLDKNSHEALLALGELDMRRAPFRPAWLTLRACTTRNLLASGPSFGERKSLLIPLQVEGELLGVWMVHLLAEVEVGADQLESFETLGRQMAASILRRRERAALRNQSGRERLRDRLETIIGGLRMLRGEQRWALELLEQLPVRALISTVWGEIEYVDPRLRQVLARRYPGLFSEATDDDDEPALGREIDPADDLRAVLARLTGKTLDEAHKLMRRVVQDGVELELETVRGLDDDGTDVWILTRVQSKRGIDLPGFKPAVHEHIVLLARSSAPARRVKTQSGGWLRLLGGSLGDR